MPSNIQKDSARTELGRRHPMLTLHGGKAAAILLAGALIAVVWWAALQVGDRLSEASVPNWAALALLIPPAFVATAIFRRTSGTSMRVPRKYRRI